MKQQEQESPGQADDGELGEESRMDQTHRVEIKGESVCHTNKSQCRDKHVTLCTVTGVPDIK